MKGNNRGFHLSTEAAITLLCAALLFSAPAQSCGESIKSLIALQKEGDLAKIWAKNCCPDSETAVADFIFAFHGGNGVVSIDGKETTIGSKGKDAVSTELFFFDSKMAKHSWKITVFD